HFRRGDDVRAMVWGVIAGLTRPNGFLIAAPLGLLVIRRLTPRGSDRTPRSVLRAAGAVVAPIAGVLAYSTYLWLEFGDPWIWARGQLAWGRSYQGLAALVVDRARMIANGGVAGYLVALPHDALNGLGALFAVATAWPVAGSIGYEY